MAKKQFNWSKNRPIQENVDKIEENQFDLFRLFSILFYDKGKLVFGLYEGKRRGYISIIKTSKNGEYRREEYGLCAMQEEFLENIKKSVNWVALGDEEKLKDESAKSENL